MTQSAKRTPQPGTSRIGRLSFVRQFHDIRNEFRAMKDRENFAHLSDDLIAEVTKAARLLFKVIDLGLISDIWQQGERPFYHLQTQENGKGGRTLILKQPTPRWTAAMARVRTRQGKQRTALSAKAKADWKIVSDIEERGMTRIPDKRLDDVQLALSWSWAIGKLALTYPERFANGAGVFDGLADNEMYIHTPSGPERSEKWYVRYYRGRAGNYADACSLIADLITHLDTKKTKASSSSNRKRGRLRLSDKNNANRQDDTPK